MATYSQLSLAKKRKNGYLQSTDTSQKTLNRLLTVKKIKTYYHAKIMLFYSIYMSFFSSKMIQCDK